MSDFEQQMRELNETHRGVSLSYALALIDLRNRTPVGRHVKTPETGMSTQECAVWVFNNQPIMDLMRHSMKINAIKETRAQTLLGLKEAKQACELAWIWEEEGRVPDSLLAQLEEDTREAIASIEQTIKERGVT